MVVALSCGIAVAASLLWDTARSNTTLSKEHFLTIQLTGSSATDSIKSGESVALSPAITNNGDVGAGEFLKVTIPAAGSSPAYVFEPSSA
jgi:hypothetical protein